MLRLMMKEREQAGCCWQLAWALKSEVLPEDKIFYQQIAEHIVPLRSSLCAAWHLGQALAGDLQAQARESSTDAWLGARGCAQVDGEEREKLSTTGFLEREQRHSRLPAVILLEGISKRSDKRKRPYRGSSARRSSRKKS